MKHHSILRVVGKIVLPYILLFALYVQFHGDFGPGGGFQAGVILAAGVILYGMIHGPEAVRRALPQRVVEGLAALGVLIYDGKLASLRRFKDDVREVKNGYECGIGVEKFNDVKPGDTFEFYVVEEVAATL